MPESRLIKRKITMSRRLNKLPLECRYLMREFILWVDKEGRLDGDPHWINRKFFCGDTDNYTDEQVAEFLQLLHDSKKNGAGLIELYKVDGVQYLWLPGFEGEQSKSWVTWTKPKEAESSIPKPQSASPSSTSKKMSAFSITQVSGDKRTMKELRVDAKLREMIDFFEGKIGRPATPKDLEQLKDMSSTYEVDTFKEAVEEAVRLGKRSLTYIERILESKQEPEPEETEPEGESGEVELE